MNKPFKVYYNDQGEITTLTVEDLDGPFVVITDEQYHEVTENMSRYQVVQGKLINVKKVKYEPPTLQFTDDFDLAQHNECYVTEKNNLFLCEQSVTIKPKNFDTTKYSWVKYDS